MSDKVLRTRRIPNEDRLEAIIALLRAEVKAWRKGGVVRQHDDEIYDEICAAITMTDAAGALEDK